MPLCRKKTVAKLLKYTFKNQFINYERRRKTSRKRNGI